MRTNYGSWHAASVTLSGVLLVPTTSFRLTRNLSVTMLISWTIAKEAWAPSVGNVNYWQGNSMTDFKELTEGFPKPIKMRYACRKQPNLSF